MSEADGIANELDNCPLLPNPDQADSNEDGIGDKCSYTDLYGNVVRDSDGDDFPDSADNCVWYPNPFQEDTTGASAIYGVPDGIGDACVEQIAIVEVTDFDLDGFTMALATGGLSFVTVDFNDTILLDQCNWTSGTCGFAADSVAACGRETSLYLALEGCSESEGNGE